MEMVFLFLSGYEFPKVSQMFSKKAIETTIPLLAK